jgi:dephospho-CoA kinase
VYRVALTGNIASGKSAVADEWSGLGAHVIDADVLARRAVEPGTPALSRIEREFGPGVIVNGRLDRGALGRIVFRDEGRRRLLESIVHPEVERLRLEAETAASQQGATIVVHVIPLLFETGMEAQFDAVVVVDAPEEVRLERLVTTRSLSGQDARAMIDAQQPAAPKRSRADHVIDNIGTLDDLKERARAVWSLIESVVA